MSRTRTFYNVAAMRAAIGWQAMAARTPIVRPSDGRCSAGRASGIVMG